VFVVENDTVTIYLRSVAECRCFYRCRGFFIINAHAALLTVRR